MRPAIGRHTRSIAPPARSLEPPRALGAGGGEHRDAIVIVFGSASLLSWRCSSFPVPRSRKRRRTLTRRLRSCGSCLPTSARRSIARLESSRSRGEHWRRCSSGSKLRTGARRNDSHLTYRRRRQRQPRSGLRRPHHSSRQAGRLPSPRRICPLWSFQQEISRVRSAFPGPSRPSSSAARREWSPFTR